MKSVQSEHAKTEDIYANEDLSDNFEENWRRAPRKLAQSKDGPLIG